MPSDRDYRDLESGHWAHLLPTECPCHGSGWLLSNFDTFHRCPIHGQGVPHPEMDYDLDPADADPTAPVFDRDAHELETWRTCWRYCQGWRRSLGFQGPMTAWVVRRTGKCPASPREWVEAAYGLLSQAAYAHDEAHAKALGFCCGLEKSLAEETWDEQNDPSYFH